MRPVISLAALVLSTSQLWAQSDKEVDSGHYQLQFEQLKNQLKTFETLKQDNKLLQAPVDPCKLNPKLPQCVK